MIRLSKKTISKKLNDELAKLLGIKPQTLYNDGIGGGTQAVAYPDFTKPDNFVLLYEHKIKVSNTKYTLAEFVYSNIDNPPKNRQEFIDGVIEMLLGAEFTNDAGKTWQREADYYIFNLKDTEKIIKSLQKLDWSY